MSVTHLQSVLWLSYGKLLTVLIKEYLHKIVFKISMLVVCAKLGWLFCLESSSYLNVN